MLKYRVYRNTRKKLWSALEKGRVALRAESLALSDCLFVVLPGGLASSRRENRRSVHAFVEGRLDPASPNGIGGERLTYDFRDGFFRVAGRRASGASLVHLLGDGSAWAFGAKR